MAVIWFYDVDVGKTRGSAQSVSRFRNRTFFQYAWQNGLYVLPEVQIVIDLIDNTTEVNIAPEFGWVFRPPDPKAGKPGLSVYVKGIQWS